MKTAVRWITYCVLAAAIGAFLTFAAPVVTSIRWTLTDAALILLAASTLGVVWIGYEWLLLGQEQDAINRTFDTWQIDSHCVAFGHSWVLAENDTVYVCLCGARVVRDAQVYDQDGAA